jgi:hypothetical protein
MAAGSSQDTPPRRRAGVMAHLLALVVLLAPTVCEAQSSAALAGTVRDLSGAPVPGATVSVADAADATDRRVVTMDSGAFELAGLLAGQPLVLVVSAPGFADARVPVSALTAGERRLVDVRLSIAGVTDTVVVTDVETIGRTQSPELGGHLSRDQIERVPVNGRDLIAVAYLVPGAAPARGFYNLAPRLTINGSSSLTTNYSIDGFDNTDLFLGGPKIPVTLGSTADLKVLVNAYSSEYGRTGNGVFSVTTRSGSNRRSGEAFYVVRPGAVMDAANALAPRDSSGEVIDDSFRRHQVGGSTGGALIADRTYYFGDFELTREFQDAVLTSPLSSGLAPTEFRSQTGMAKLDVKWNTRQWSTVRYHASDVTHDGNAGFVGALTLPSAGLVVNYRNQYSSVTHRIVGDVGVTELGVQVGRLGANWRTPDLGPRAVVTDRGRMLATVGGVSDDFDWTESDLQVRDVYTRVMNRHTLKLGGDLLHGGSWCLSRGP